MSETQDNKPNPMRTTPPTWAGKICPVLSVGSMKPAEASKIMTPGGGKPAQQGGSRVTLCQGGACMFFVPQLSADGRPDGDGACAITMAPLAVNVLTQHHIGMFEHVMKMIPALNPNPPKPPAAPEAT